MCGPPSYIFMTWCFVKQRDNSTCTLPYPFPPLMKFPSIMNPKNPTQQKPTISPYYKPVYILTTHFSNMYFEISQVS